MKSLRLLTHGILLSATLVAASAQANVIVGTVADTNFTQLGRLSRNGIPQDFAGDEQFPGIVNSGTTYNYAIYAISLGANNNFVEVTIDTPGLDFFGSAYQTRYVPDSAGSPNFGFDRNWLGDSGTSNFNFGGPTTDPAFFDVVGNPNSTLLIIVNTTLAGATPAGDMFTLSAQGFSDSDFDNPVDLTLMKINSLSQIPEPSTLLLLLAPLGLMAVRRRRTGATRSQSLAV